MLCTSSVPEWGRVYNSSSRAEWHWWSLRCPDCWCTTVTAEEPDRENILQKQTHRTNKSRNIQYTSKRLCCFRFTCQISSGSEKWVFGSSHSAGHHILWLPVVSPAETEQKHCHSSGAVLCFLYISKLSRVQPFHLFQRRLEEIWVSGVSISAAGFTGLIAAGFPAHKHTLHTWLNTHTRTHSRTHSRVRRETHALRRPAASTMALWWLKRLIMAQLLFSLSVLLVTFEVEGAVAVP